MKHLNKILAMLAFFALGLFALSCGDDDPAKPVEPSTMKITSLSPAKILPQQVVTIKGQGFGADQSSSRVEFGGVKVENYVLWSDGEIRVVVPTITSAGLVTIYKDSVKAEYAYTLNSDPYIMDAARGAAYPEEKITIKGVNFGSSNGTVSFAGTAADGITKWTDTEIELTVPKTAATGMLIVKNSAGTSSNEYDFTVSKNSDPYISMIDAPDEVEVGTIITIKGSNFGASQGTSFVEINGVRFTEYSDWKTNAITCKVPVGASSGLVKVCVNGQKSRGVNQPVKSLVPAPVIQSLNKSSFKVGEEMVLHGLFFGDDYDPAKCSLTLGSLTVQSDAFVEWTKTVIKITVPHGAQSGNAVVKVGSKSSNAFPYTIVGESAVSISYINPTIATVGATIEIAGKGFGATRGSSVVKFTGADATEYVSWSDTKIEVKVPQDAASGPVKVQVNGVLSDGVNFQVQQTFKLLELVSVPAGSFKMGNPDNDAFDDVPVNQITISKGFYMSKFEITQDQYKKIMGGSNPSRVKADNAPVDGVNWEKAVDFCNRLSKQEGYTPCYTKQKRRSGDSVWVCNFSANGYRLPTEAEWEYSARAGSTEKYYGALNSIAWYDGSKVASPQVVGQKQPNAFGLYDMLGNVSEWVNDWYNSSYYELIPKTDPKGPDFDPSSPEKVYRGGSYTDGPDALRAYIRASNNPKNSEYYIGFRVVRNK